MAWSVFSEENFQKMVQYAPIGIVIIDRELKWRFVNDRFCEITGFSREELAGKTFLDITHPGDVDRNLGLYNRLLCGEINEYSYEKRYIRKNGEVIWVRLAVSAVHVDQQYSHMVVSVQDIDETKKSQHMLEVRNEELDMLLYKASHDLKSPVTTLEGLCHLLQVELPVLENSAAFIHLRETVQRLKNQNESLLELTRINEYTPLIQPVLLSRLLDQVISDVLPSAAVEQTGTHVLINTDARLLEAAVRRVLQNASIYSRPRVPLKVQIALEVDQGWKSLAITDNGVGIPPSEITHVLGMFHRSSPDSRGSGLGLYIALKAMEKLNGEIRVESMEGVGSSFSLLLPPGTMLESPEEGGF